MKKSIIFNCVPPFDTHLPSPALSILKSWLAKHNISAPDVHMRKTADRVDEIIDDIFSRIDFSELVDDLVKALQKHFPDEMENVDINNLRQTIALNLSK